MVTAFPHFFDKKYQPRLNRWSHYTGRAKQYGEWLRRAAVYVMICKVHGMPRAIARLWHGSQSSSHLWLFLCVYVHMRLLDLIRCAPCNDGESISQKAYMTADRFIPKLQSLNRSEPWFEADLHLPVLIGLGLHISLQQKLHRLDAWQPCMQMPLLWTPSQLLVDGPPPATSISLIVVIHKFTNCIFKKSEKYWSVQ